ncbi:hypothetical protein M2650_07590 [Luteimonas sp. SX5]|uniref:GGDEF domain-containing protein n=1 Tax=Luteimonas galliterrae TaxID=2940486 RepID=A0ABT0MIH9_9GAMM|nr:hypothetical protein [Luteimonas galliterrae]MCL1634493.1 hypothetical protein [Luteimonas galliterrae]
MTKFEYLSVLTSIIIGLALANLLSGAARLIQLRARVRPHATTLCWMAMLFLGNIQVWWVAFERREAREFSFFAFLLYLMMPIAMFLVSYLVLPDLGDEDAVDLPANFEGNRVWFFGLLALVPGVSLIEEWVKYGAVPLDTDAAFRIVFVALCVVAVSIRSARFHFWNALFVLAGFVAYVSTLFLQLA